MLRWDSLLFGSVSSRGRPVPSRPPATTGATAVLLPLRDSTGAPPSSSATCLEPQPASRAASRAGIRIFFMGFSGEILTGGRPPGRLADIAAGDRQALLDTAVTGDGGKDTPTAGFGGDQDHSAIGRKTRRLVARGIGQYLHLAAGQIEH